MKLLLALFLLIPLTVLADVKIINLPIYCVNVKTLSEVLEKHGEEAAMTMSSSRDIQDQIITSSTVLFVNFKTKTWTMVERLTNDNYCVIAVGDNITPFTK
jgi:hypothetical protein